ncbi:MAG: DUF5058 family protein [Christensenellales bacterium]
MPTDYASLYVIGGIIAATIIAMSLFFLIKSLKRAKEIGMERAKVMKAIKSSAVFSIVPSIPIVIGIGIMMSYLGLAIPWIRLTVIGALQYELIAMDQINITTAEVITRQMVATALVIMTISIISGPLFNAIAYKKLQGKLVSLEKNNKKLLDTITGSLLGGILAGLASYIIIAAIFSSGASDGDGVTSGANGVITLITLGVSMVIMAVCGLLIKKLDWKWLENYALPFTILLSMGSAWGLTFIIRG